MYHNYFGLKEPAFSIAVNPKYLYMSSQHKEALAHLIYGVQGGGFVLLSGEVGTGKTTIVRCLLEQMPGDTEIAFVLNPMADVEGLLSTVCEELRVATLPAVPSIKDMMDALQEKLLQNHADGKRTVLLIDEAQLLSADVLEQIRLLTNLETSTDKLLQIVLVGQPEVNELLAQPRLRQLSQRITARFHLEALSLSETKQYIEHRLSVAGKKEGRVIFPDKIIKKIHQFSGGVPRLINILSERLLVGAYGHNKYEIDKHTFNRALAEVEGLKPNQAQQAKLTYNWNLPLIALIVLVSLSALVLLGDRKAENIAHETAQSSRTQNTTVPAEISDAPNPEHVTPHDDSVETPKTEPEYEFLFNSAGAHAQLFNYYEVPIDEYSHPCWQTDEHLLSCTPTKIETWDELFEINRPAILSLVTDNRELKYVIVVGSVAARQDIDSDSLLVLNKQNDIITVDKNKISSQWNGSVSYLWKKPSGYSAPLRLGAKSAVVEWVANQFSLLDNQANAITNDVFTHRLETRIKIFQTSNDLKPDGILGERTIMMLNEHIGQAKTLIER